ncbi:MAG: ABC transporter ATP-binding protein [Kiloniellaceae bacterium]
MTGTGARLELVRLVKRYGALAALEAVDLGAEPGEIVAITGPSGAGKSTVCRLVSGVERPNFGRIVLAGTDVTRAPPQRRSVAYMFESYALYPHLTVYDNIASPLRSPRQKGRHDEASIARRIGEVLSLTEMAGLERRFPAELSGGQKQRVALCRTLVQDPEVTLLDEPIAHLDAKLRHTLRGAIRRRQIERPAPTLWCTPDAMEALSVGDRVVVLVEGRIQQVGTPEEVYLRPANTSVARLIGDPAMNLLPGRFEETPAGLVFRHEAGTVPISDRASARLRGCRSNADYVLGVRPSEISIANGAAARHGAPATVYTFEPFGKYSIATVRLGERLVKIKTTDPVKLDSGSPIRVGFRPADYAVFDAASGRAV